MVDSFKVEGPYGRHTCLVLEVAGHSLYELRDISADRKLDANILRPIIRHLLGGLQFLHEKARIIHTGQSSQVHSPERMLIVRRSTTT